ncbi:hypothetical protein BCPG_00115 [Burkholderia cenocepacia PC184]|nr:hypothetical protein BCPG_00115 [Burkholderia cenocepacia PC184]
MRRLSVPPDPQGPGMLARQSRLPRRRRSDRARRDGPRWREPFGRGGSMKRWLMILLFAAGGLATEIAHPVQCTLLSISRQPTGKRREPG